MAAAVDRSQVESAGEEQGLGVGDDEAVAVDGSGQVGQVNEGVSIQGPVI